MGIYAGGWATVGESGFMDELGAGDSVLSDPVDMQNCKRVDLLLQVTFASAPASGGTVDIYALAGNDDVPTVYASGSDTVTPQASSRVASLDLAGVGTSQVLQAFDVAVPVGDNNVLLVTNNTSVEITTATLQVLPNVKAV